MNKETLYKFFDRQASKEEKESVRLWIESSSENKKEFLRERAFFDSVLLLGGTEKSKSKSKNKIYHNFVLKEVLKIAAICFIVFSTSLYFYKMEIDKIASTMNTIIVPSGQHVNIILPDSTKVWLNSRSEMYFPAAFVGDKREVKLNGEAYFEVKSDKEKPFIVNTNKCSIKVRGTKFNVDSYNDSEIFCTSLIEGSVQVSEIENPSKSIILRPHQKVIFKDNKFSTSHISDYDIFRWKEGLICFQNLNFNQLMSRLEKYYGIKIIVQNKKLIQYVCSGKFCISDGIDNALRILQKDVNFIFDRDEEKSTIYIK